MFLASPNMGSTDTSALGVLQTGGTRGTLRSALTAMMIELFTLAIIAGPLER
jgi:hypothetical protein